MSMADTSPNNLLKTEQVKELMLLFVMKWKK